MAARSKKKTAKSTKGRSVVLLVFRGEQFSQSHFGEATRLDFRVKHASNELMNATTGPVFLAAFEDPDEVLEFAISLGLYVFVVRRAFA